MTVTQSDIAKEALTQRVETLEQQMVGLQARFNALEEQVRELKVDELE